MKMRLAIVFAAACGSSSPKPAPIVVENEPPTVGQEGDDSVVMPETTVERDVLGSAMHVFGSMKSTAYTHKTTIDAPSGKFEFDCSGFVGYVLAQSQPRALAELRMATKKRPLAKHFVTFFQNLPAESAWRKIATTSDCRASSAPSNAWSQRAPTTTC
jgi:hypothetical protein